MRSQGQAGPPEALKASHREDAPLPGGLAVFQEDSAGDLQVGSARAARSAQDDEFDYVFSGGQREARTHKQEFKPKALPPHLVTNVRAQPLAPVGETSDASEEEDERQTGTSKQTQASRTQNVPPSQQSFYIRQFLKLSDLEDSFQPEAPVTITVSSESRVPHHASLAISQPLPSPAGPASTGSLPIPTNHHRANYLHRSTAPASTSMLPSMVLAGQLGAAQPPSPPRAAPSTSPSASSSASAALVGAGPIEVVVSQVSAGTLARLSEMVGRDALEATRAPSGPSSITPPDSPLDPTAGMLPERTRNSQPYLFYATSTTTTNPSTTNNSHNSQMSDMPLVGAPPLRQAQLPAQPSHSEQGSLQPAQSDKAQLASYVGIRATAAIAAAASGSAPVAATAANKPESAPDVLLQPDKQQQQHRERLQDVRKGLLEKIQRLTDTDNSHTPKCPASAPATATAPYQIEVDLDKVRDYEADRNQTRQSSGDPSMAVYSMSTWLPQSTECDSRQAGSSLLPCSSNAPVPFFPGNLDSPQNHSSGCAGSEETPTPHDTLGGDSGAGDGKCAAGAEGEWEIANARVLAAAAAGDANGAAGAARAVPARRRVYADLSWDVAALKHSPETVRAAQQMLPESNKAPGFFAKLFCLAPKDLTPNIRDQIVQVVCCAKTPYSESCPLHWDMLCSSYLAFTGGEVVPSRYGKHWAVLGWQGDDPATDLRACGILGLLQLCSLYDGDTETAKSTFQLSRDPLQEFPLAIVSINCTKYTLQALRAGKLNDAIQSAGSVWLVISVFHRGALRVFANTWREGKKTMVQSGFVMKEIETLCLNNPARVLREGGFTAPRAR